MNAAIQMLTNDASELARQIGNKTRDQRDRMERMINDLDHVASKQESSWSQIGRAGESIDRLDGNNTQRDMQQLEQLRGALLTVRDSLMRLSFSDGIELSDDERKAIEPDLRAAIEAGFQKGWSRSWDEASS